MNPQPFISVIIPTYNRLDFLMNLLNDLAKQNYQNFEIIVVDQSEKSFPELQKCINSLKLKIVYLKDQGRGFPRARNIGLHYSKGNFIVFLDDDVIIPETEFLTEHVKC